MRRTLRPCLQCHRLTSNGTRCPSCQALTDQAKWQRRPLTNAERKRRATAVHNWRTEYGEHCPGIPAAGIPPHATHPGNPLTADHLHPVALGGSESGEIVVRCRRCNSIKSSRYAG